MNVVSKYHRVALSKVSDARGRYSLPLLLPRYCLSIRNEVAFVRTGSVHGSSFEDITADPEYSCDSFSLGHSTD